MVATTPKALAKRARNRKAKREESKTTNFANKAVVKRMIKKALASQLERLRPALLQRKKKYDQARKFDEHAIRNDAASWTK